MQNGLIHIYCGDGKGKTTASVGLCVRAAGRGMRVLFAQFLKSDDSGEREILRSIPNITVAELPARVKFVKSMTEAEFDETKRFFSSLFERCADAARDGSYDLIVLDEICSTVGHGIVPANSLAAMLREKAPGVELVLTGRDPDPAIVALADYVTEMTLVKHPYQAGVPARRGIEF